MSKTKTTEVALIDLDAIDVNKLPELADFKSRGSKLVKECKFVKIEDNSTYDQAKKHRTALRSFRTEVQKQEKTIKDKLNSFKSRVVDASNLLIGITQEAENKQQEEVTRWEDIKEQERLEKARLEQERIDGIKKSIGEFRQKWEDKVSELVFETIEDIKCKYSDEVKEFDRIGLDEFEVLFDDSVDYLDKLLTSKISTLEEQEQIRVDNLLIEEKNAEQKRINEWQSTWSTNIDTLKFSDVVDVKESFKTSKLGDLKHYRENFVTIYDATEIRLHSQVEFVSKQETQRLAIEKFNKEKKEFEEKQLKIRTENRIKQLRDLGFTEYGQNGYILFDGIICADYQIIKFEDTQFDLLVNSFKDKITESKENELIKVKLDKLPNGETVWVTKEGVNELTNEPIASKTETIVSNQIVQSDYQEEDVDPKGILPSSPIVKKPKEYDVSKMNYNDKLELLTSWLNNLDEFALDGLIEEYFNN